MEFVRPFSHVMIDSLAIVSIIRHHTRIELDRQWSEYDVLRLILREAEQMASQHGRLTDAIDTSIVLCAKYAKVVRDQFDLVEVAMAETRMKKKWIAMFRCYWRREERRFALLAFRDTVLLLRDLVNR